MLLKYIFLAIIIIGLIVFGYFSTREHFQVITPSLVGMGCNRHNGAQGLNSNNCNNDDNCEVITPSADSRCDP